MDDNNPYPIHTDNDDDDDQTLQFHMPQFVYGALPNVAPGGGAEVVPCMYGHDWNQYSACSQYEHPVPSRYLSIADLDVENSAGPSTPARPFDYSDDDNVTVNVSINNNNNNYNSNNYYRPSPAPPPPPPPTHMHAAVFPVSFPTLTALDLDPTAPLPPIPRTGLPLYSATGFDMLSILAKVATRPTPKIMLGPVDMTCSFVVVDVRRFDAPIVYVSPTFTRLTGYPESQVLGRNCRFLQSPNGNVARGEPRRFTAPDAVRHLQKSLLQEKECQASLINYRKDGSAFINLVTVIPVAADDASDEITHHVGFQVDLAEQPNAILQKLRDGSYFVNYSSSQGPVGATHLRRARGVSIHMAPILRAAAATTMMTVPVPEQSTKPARDNERAALHALLLENTDDFIHVVSLKGALLYVAPAVSRVLGYDPASLIGKSIVDLCHPADVVPLMRELKEASAIAPAYSPPPSRPSTTQGPRTTTTTTTTTDPSTSTLFVFPPPPSQLPAPTPKPVHLLFRARHQSGAYLWLEARGRLHVEQGKGRKAVVLVGRRTSVPRLAWRAVREPGGSWGLVAPNALVLAASGAARAWVGRSLAALVAPPDARRVVDVLAAAACATERGAVRRVGCALAGSGGGAGAPRAELLFYAEGGAPPVPPRLVFQLRLAGAGSGSGSGTGTSVGVGVEGKREEEDGEGDGDVMGELDTARATSWQYELTRLRFENERMREEIRVLERRQRRACGGVGGGGGGGGVKRARGDV